MPEKKVKIEIELDQDKKLEIDLISKAFGMDQEAFAKLAIEHEIGFIKDIFGFNNVKDDLETYYHFEINIDELRKLNLLEAI